MNLRRTVAMAGGLAATVVACYSQADVYFSSPMMTVASVTAMGLGLYMGDRAACGIRRQLPRLDAIALHNMDRLYRKLGI